MVLLKIHASPFRRSSKIQNENAAIGRRNKGEDLAVRLMLGEKYQRNQRASLKAVHPGANRR